MTRLTPLQRKQLETLKEKEKGTDTPSTTSSKPTASEVPPRPKSPSESKDLPPDTFLFSKTRDTPSPVPPPSDETDSESSSEHSEVTSLPPSPGSPASPDPTTSRSPSPDRTSGTVKDLADALTKKLKDIGRHSTIPLSQFRRKMGEDPNDHCMKVEDYFAIFSIESDDDQKKRSLENLFEKAR